MRKRKILLALSDAFHAKRVRDLLGTDAFTISTAGDGETALERIAKSKFETVVLDASSRGGEKKAAIKKLLKAIPDVPVMIICDDGADICPAMREFGTGRRYLCWQHLDAALLLDMLMTVRTSYVGKSMRGEGDDRFSKAFAASPGMSAISTPKDGLHLDVNDAWLSTLGFKRHEVIGKTVKELGLWVDAKVRSRLVRKIKKDGYVRGFEASLRAKNGDVIDLLISGELIESGGEQLLLMVSQRVLGKSKGRVSKAFQASPDLYSITNQLLEKIDRLEKAEQALILSEQRHRDMAEADSDWLWETDSQLRYSHFSDSVRTVVGLDPMNFIGKKRNMIAAPGEDPEKWKRHERDLRERKPFRNFRYQINTPLGEELFVQISGKPVFDDKGKFIGYRGTGTNITELLRAEQGVRDALSRAEMANKAKSNFLAGMSHELRTPLNAIIGFSDAIKSELFGPIAHPRYEGYVENINDSGKHLLQLINDVLDVSKIEAGAMEMNDAEIDMASIIDRAMRLVETRAKEGKIKLKRKVPKRVPALLADERRVVQMLLNLLTNAVKFTRKNGTVEVSAGQTAAGNLFMRVADTGIGIKAANISKIMTEFGRIDNSIANKDEGTGLGLPLTKGLVELHGGTLKIESKLGKGTVVTVMFPETRTLGK